VDGRPNGRTLLCVVGARWQFSDKPLHKQIRSLFNQSLMIFIDRRHRRRTANEIFLRTNKSPAAALTPQNK
jgi:hypothetical protein